MQVLVWRERWAAAGRVSDAATDTILSTPAEEVWSGTHFCGCFKLSYKVL